MIQELLLRASRSDLNLSNMASGLKMGSIIASLLSRKKKKKRLVMEHNKNNHSNKFLDGFLWGFIIGGAVVFLIGTKKGKLLKQLQKGMGGISDIIDGGLMDEEAEDDYEDVEDDVEDPSSAKASEGNGKVSMGRRCKEK